MATSKTSGLSAPVLAKAISAISFQPKLRFYTLSIPAAEQLANEFPDWWTDHASVAVRNYEHYNTIALQHQKVTYEQDNPDAALLARHVESLFDRVAPLLEIDELQRVGVRAKFLAKSSWQFDDLVAVADARLFSNSEKLRKWMPPHVTDLMYRIDAREGNALFHIGAGPVKAAEIPRWVEANMELVRADQRESVSRKRTVEYPAVAFFLDIDMYLAESGIKLSEGKAFAKQALAKLPQMAKSLVEYLAEKPKD